MLNLDVQCIFMCVLIIVMIQSVSCTVQTYEDEKALKDYLFSPARYSKSIRPLRNRSHTLQVNISQQVLSMRYLDVTVGEICVISYLLLSWKDELLQWNSSEYGDISVIDLADGEYWKPLPDNIDTCGDFHLEAANVSNDGVVRLFVTQYILSACVIDMTLFPFDKHVCSFNFFNWNYNSTEMVFVTDSTQPLITGNFFQSQEWEVYGKDIFHYSYPINAIPFSFATFTMSLIRRSRFILVNTLLPVNVLACMNIFLPFIPPDSGERLSFAVTGCLAMIFISMAVVGTMPRNSITITLSSWNFLALNLIYVIGIVWSIFIIRISKIPTSHRKVPNVMVRLFGRKSQKYQTKSNDQHNFENSEKAKDEDNSSADKQQTAEDTTVTWYDVATYLDRIYFLFSVLVYASLIVVNYVYIKDSI